MFTAIDSAGMLVHSFGRAYPAVRPPFSCPDCAAEVVFRESYTYEREGLAIEVANHFAHKPNSLCPQARTSQRERAAQLFLARELDANGYRVRLDLRADGIQPVPVAFEPLPGRPVAMRFAARNTSPEHVKLVNRADRRKGFAATKWVLFGTSGPCSQIHPVRLFLMSYYGDQPRTLEFRGSRVTSSPITYRVELLGGRFDGQVVAHFAKHPTYSR